MRRPRCSQTRATRLLSNQGFRPCETQCWQHSLCPRRWPLLSRALRRRQPMIIPTASRAAASESPANARTQAMPNAWHRRRDARFPATSIRASPSGSSGAGAQIGLTEPTEHRSTVADRPEVRLHDKYRQARAEVSCDYNRSLMSRHCRRWQQIQIPRLDEPCR